MSGLFFVTLGSGAAQNVGTQDKAPFTELIRTRVELKGILLAKQVDSHLKQNDLVMMAIGDFWSANPNVSPAIAQSRMKRYQRAAAGLRTILAVNADGKLVHYSYDFPAPDLNLGDRLYVREALAQGSSDLRINLPVVGRQTGLPFIPITRGLFNVEGEATGVIVGILGPETLLPEDSNCAYCISAVLTNDLDILVSRPSGLQLSEDLKQHIQETMSSSGMKLIEENGGLLLVSWTKNDYADVITVVGELLSQ